MKKAFIFGASGHGNVIASILKNRYTEIFFVDLFPTAGNLIQELDFFNQIEKYKREDIFLGIGSNQIRTKLFQKLTAYNIVPATCIADSVFIAHDAHIGNGVVVCPGAVIASKAVLENNTIVNTLSSVDHDCFLGEHSQITAGVTFGGNTRVGKNCFFGIKSATIPNITVGDNSIIMAGSIVYKDVPENVMVGGNPARIVKRIE